MAKNFGGQLCRRANKIIKISISLGRKILLMTRVQGRCVWRYAGTYNNEIKIVIGEIFVFQHRRNVWNQTYHLYVTPTFNRCLIFVRSF